MNISLLLMGIFLNIIGILFTVITFGFGILCTWPLYIIGFIMIVFGIITPSPSSNQEINRNPPDQTNTKRICSHCGKTMAMDVKKCPHCGKNNKYV